MSMISFCFSPPPPTNNVGYQESNTSLVSCSVTVLQHCLGGAGKQLCKLLLEGLCLPSIFKLLTKRLKKTKCLLTDLNQLATIVAHYGFHSVWKVIRSILGGDSDFFFVICQVYLFGVLVSQLLICY